MKMNDVAALQIISKTYKIFQIQFWNVIKKTKTTNWLICSVVAKRIRIQLKTERLKSDSWLQYTFGCHSSKHKDAFTHRAFLWYKLTAMFVCLQSLFNRSISPQWSPLCCVLLVSSSCGTNWLLQAWVCLFRWQGWSISLHVACNAPRPALERALICLSAISLWLGAKTLNGSTLQWREWARGTLFVS